MKLTDYFCGFCGADLRAGQIPVEHIGAGFYGDLDPGKAHFYSRLIGVEYLGGYDGVSEWLCPDCGVRVGRWSGRVLSDGETEQRYGGQSLADAQEAA